VHAMSLECSLVCWSRDVETLVLRPLTVSCVRVDALEHRRADPNMFDSHSGMHEVTKESRWKKKVSPAQADKFFRRLQSANPLAHCVRPYHASYSLPQTMWSLPSLSRLFRRLGLLSERSALVPCRPHALGTAVRRPPLRDALVIRHVLLPSHQHAATFRVTAALHPTCGASDTPRARVGVGWLGW
jgi:hypothetical protein